MNDASAMSVAASNRPPHFDEEEWALRVKLAASYRIFDHLGWTLVIFNHITVRLPGPEHHFLINPFGLRYDEVAARLRHPTKYSCVALSIRPAANAWSTICWSKLSNKAWAPKQPTSSS